MAVSPRTKWVMQDQSSLEEVEVVESAEGTSLAVAIITMPHPIMTQYDCLCDNSVWWFRV